MIKKQVTVNSTCSKCGKEFKLGYTGIFENDCPTCDKCAEVTRAKNGYAIMPGETLKHFDWRKNRNR
jgi:hypothetical protein